jgi:hypothetical protein
MSDFYYSLIHFLYSLFDHIIILTPHCSRTYGLSTRFVFFG